VRQIIMRKLLVAGIVLTAAMNTAQAADMPVKAPIPSAYNWTGFYLGANVGYGWGNRSADFAANDSASAFLFGIILPAAGGNPAPPTSFKSSGVLGGVQLGYNWQFNSTWLLGLETDIDWAGLKGSGSSGATSFGGNQFVMTSEERIKWFGTVRARLGYLPMDNLLAYVTGGFAYGRVEHTAPLDSTTGDISAFHATFGYNCFAGTTCFAGSSSRIATGWTAGTGFEYAVWRNVTLKAEYLYVNLGGNSVTEPALVHATGAGATTALSSITANYGRTNFNVARVGVNFRY